jgi:hypothetical protein
LARSPFGGGAKRGRYRNRDPVLNNATICSYPYEGWTAAFPGLGLRGWTAWPRRNRGQRAPIPTAVGFCMYIRRACLEQAEHSTRSASAAATARKTTSASSPAAGWRHVLAADVFVFHEARSAFPRAARSGWRRRAATLLDRHPDTPR